VSFERPTRADVVPPKQYRDPTTTRLTRAEERALRRSAPLTSAQFKELRRLAEQGVSPLRHT
jgi:hypothetical protein